MTVLMSLREPFQRNGGRWYYEIDRKRKSLGTSNEQEARRLFNAIKRLYLDGKITRMKGETTKTLGEFHAEFKEWAVEAQNPDTYRANRLALDKLLAQAGGSTRLDRVSPKHLDDIIKDCRQRGLSVHSINNYIRHARSALNKAVEWEYIKVNPLRSVKEIRTSKKEPQAIAMDKLAKFLASIQDADVRTLATAYVVTGRRRRELFDLTWEDVDFKRGRYRVTIKGGDEKFFPLTAAFRAVLEEIGPGSGRVWPRWTHRDTASKIVKAALRGAGLGAEHLHRLRHSYARMFLEGGGDLRELQDLLGHAEYRTTEIYASLGDEHLKKTAERVKIPVTLKAVK
jgi:site-specific recombinase XerC